MKISIFIVLFIVRISNSDTTEEKEIYFPDDVQAENIEPRFGYGGHSYSYHKQNPGLSSGTFSGLDSKIPMHSLSETSDKRIDGGKYYEQTFRTADGRQGYKKTYTVTNVKTAQVDPFYGYQTISQTQPQQIKTNQGGYTYVKTGQSRVSYDPSRMVQTGQISEFQPEQTGGTWNTGNYGYRPGIEQQPVFNPGVYYSQQKLGPTYGTLGTSDIEGGDIKEHTANFIQGETYKSCRNIEAVNSQVLCSQNSCRIKCAKGHKFPTGEREVNLVCSGGNWLKDNQILYSQVSSCEPECFPPCENKGICISNGICECPEDYHGQFCEKKKIFCLARPVGVNMKLTCSNTMCTAVCREGYKFPDGSKVTNMACEGGVWKHSPTGQNHPPDCKPTCNPPCQNGGSCYSVNLCSCTKEYHGTQCQYDYSVCNITQVGFNGLASCNYQKDSVVCTISCPLNIKFEFPSVTNYTCQYSMNKFVPNMPKCVYPRGTTVIRGNQQAKKVHQSTMTITSSSVITELDDVYSLYVTSNVIVKEPGPGVCITWGGINMKTFDGLIFRAPLYCAHTLVKDSENEITITKKTCPYEAKNCKNVLFIYLQNILYTCTVSDGNVILTTPKKRLPVPAQILGMKVVQVAKFLRIEFDKLGLVVLWDLKEHVSIEANAQLFGRLSGLCGTFDMDRENDFSSRSGTPLKSVQAFVDEWSVPAQNEDCKPQKLQLETLVCDNVAETKATEICTRLIKNKKLKECVASCSEEKLLQFCVDNYCKCQNKKNPKSCACDALSIWAKECTFKGIKLENGWRDLEVCPVECTNGRIYSPCGPATSPTCGSIKNLIKESCHEGCYCPDGTVQHRGECILPELCPCTKGKKVFLPGTVIKEDCNSCTCTSGVWSCSNETCGARCAAIGDPHYTTFDGKRYDFMGKCSYYLLKTGELSIVGENVPCPGSISAAMNLPPTLSSELPSCTKSVTIQIPVNGKDFSIKLAQGPIVYVNNNEILKYPKIIGDDAVVIRQASSNFVSVDLPNGVRVWWDGITRVYIDAPASLRHTTQGLCGTFNSNTQDDFLTPENDIETAVEPFAEKWRTDETCGYAADAPAVPNTCETNPANKEKGEEKCMKILSDVFEECNWSVEPEPFYENCMFDVCACKGDLDACICPILAAYAAECSRQGIETDWRANITECDLKCPQGQVYEECGDGCVRSCDDISRNDTCSSPCVEGCRCPKGQYLNDKNECIPEKMCPCKHDGLSFIPGHKEVRTKGGVQQLCTCTNGAWNCVPATPEDLIQYPPVSELKEKCEKRQFSEFTKCAPKEPKTCKNMHEYVQTLEDCSPDCVCKSGYVLDVTKDVCVLPTHCSCHHAGKSYSDGEVIKEDCNKCKCQGGKWDCTKNVCASTCSVWGDSHFSTFDNKDFDFQGACDYVLSKGTDSSGDGFIITIQNVLCGSLGVTCSKSVKIALTGSSKDSLTLSSDPADMKAMQKYKKFDDNSTNSFVVYNAGVFVVVEVLDLGLQLKWDRGTRVYIKLNNQWKSKVSGLCGNYNNDAQDDMATPSLSLETSPTIFGHSWKLEDYCSAPVEPIDSCNEHPERKTWAHHKCGILKSDVFKECHGEVPYEKYMKRCIFDTCACDQGGDCECLCTALAAYAYDCSTKGIKIKWRTQDLCPMQCDPHCSEYSSCTQACPVETCDNFREQGAVERICSTESCSEGCHIKPCDDGQIYLNDTFTECVPKATCKPVCMQKQGITYYEGDITQSDGCQICRCVKQQEICTGEPCSTPLFVTPTTPTVLSTEPPIGVGGICNPAVPHVEYPGDCYKFLHCLPKPNGEWAYVEKTCGPSMMYNPTNMICDHIYSVKLIKPECGEPVLSTPRPTTHEPMILPDCDVLNPFAESFESCYAYKECVKSGINWIYVDKYCLDGKMFNPSTRKCDDPNVVSLIKPICRIATLATTASFGPTTVAPQRLCIKENIIPIVTGFPGLPDSVFSATSSLGPGSLPKYARINGKPTSISNGSWSPITNDPNQYLQIDLPQVIPLYGIEMQGSPIFDQFVTSYKITYSDDGKNFLMLSDDAGSPHIFQGPQTSRDSANNFFKAPIEAQVVRIYPMKWHGAISMRVELYGCSDREILKPETQTTVLQIKPTPKPKPPPSKCSDYMTEESQFTPEQVKASSELLSPSVKGKKPRLNEMLKLTSPIAWRPKVNKKLQYVSFDFREPRNLTGLITKGGPVGWVTSYVVRYSKNGKIWNNIAPDQIPQIFVGNYDSDTPNINYFMYPIRAQTLKIVPVTWHDNINMRIEPLGCFEPIDTKTTPIPVVPERICNICPEVDVNLMPFGDKCKCEEPLYWEGSKCVERNLCPCVSNNVRYKNGDVFENANCEKCTCLEGSSQCVEKKCDPCPKGLRRDLSNPCSCLCKECPPTERLCPSSGDCIPEALWCNGYQDCEDDEKDCSVEPTAGIDEFMFIKNTCPAPSCPNGMEVKLTNNPRKMSMMFETGSTDTSRSPTVQPPSSTNCVEYTCVYTLIGKPTFCPPPVCANNYEEVLDTTVVVGPNECPSYNCVPIRQADRTCKNVGKSFATFDGTEFKYDACNHILARDLKGLSWIVTLNLNCSYDYKSSRCQKEVIIRDKLEKYVLVLLPSLKVKFNNYEYDVHQLEKSSYDQFGFLISQPGKTISYVSKTHGFWVVYGSDGDVEIGMSLDYVNTVDGLCGFFNDDPSDDKRLPNGKLARNTAEFGDAWVSKEVPNTVCKAQVCADEGHSAWDICNTIKDEVFDACSKIVNYQQFVLKCVETTCECLKAGQTPDGVSCKCAALERYVKECLSINPDVHLDTWRGSHNCEISCTPPLLYKDCYKRRCEPSCNNINKNSCPLVQKECFSGCFCPEGTVRKGETCVSVNDCKTCICTEFGKSKFVTYDRQNFTFDGNCTYLLSRDILVPGVYNFQVYVTMGNCDKDQKSPHSCAKSLHIIHDSHIIHMQKKPNGETQILVDGLEPSALPTKNSWLELQKNGKNEIIVKLLNSHVDVYSSFEDMTFSIHVPSVKYGSKMEGLCGDCDLNPDNDLKVNAKSKKEITGNTIKDIAESWAADEPKLGSDIGECVSDEVPRDECIVPDPAVDPCLKLLDKDLFGKCHLFVDPVIYLSACQQDLCVPGSSQQGVCESLTAYAHECLRNGICVDWRRTGLCPFECPAQLQYNHCGCLKTCETRKDDYMLDLIDVRSSTSEKMKKSAGCSGELYEGCFCPEGKVSLNDRCVPEKECTLCDDQVHYQGDAWMKDKCTECTCNKQGKIECTKKDCSVQGTICTEGFDVKIIKDVEECCPKYICVPVVVPTLVTKPNVTVTCPEQKPLKCSQYRTNKLKKQPNGCFEFECVCIPKQECPPIKNKSELNLKPGEEVQLEASDCCSTQKIVCEKSLCPPKPAMCDVFYVLKEIVKDKECCPEYKCVPPENTCIVNIGDVETLKKVGDKWQDPKDPCVQKMCSFGPNGELKEMSERTVCDLYCAKGFKYTAEPGKCCGKCVQVMCIHGDQIHKPGEVWFSEDNCTKHTCVERENQLSISSYQETCPNIEDCPDKFRFEDGCCIKCNLPPMPQTNCLSESLAETETLGLIQVKSQAHGLCVNKQPIIGFTECRGSCASGTKFNPGSYGQEKVCDCCSILWYEKIEVPLSCPNGSTIKKIIQIPSLCGCQPCAETVKPSSKTAMNW